MEVLRLTLVSGHMGIGGKSVYTVQGLAFRVARYCAFAAPDHAKRTN